MIPETILKQYDAKIRSFEKGNIIFHTGEDAHYYYQIISGQVKMCYYNEKGTEFLLGVFSDNQSFGEPPLIGGFVYPANAEVIEDSKLYLLEKDKLKELFKDNFEIHLEFTKTLSKKIAYKSLMLKEIAVYEPEHRILSILDYFKNTFIKEKFKSLNKTETKKFKIPFTRQQLANMTGLSVETVIRSIKKLESKNELEIIKGKIYR